MENTTGVESTESTEKHAIVTVKHMGTKQVTDKNIQGLDTQEQTTSFKTIANDEESHTTRDPFTHTTRGNARAEEYDLDGK